MLGSTTDILEEVDPLGSFVVTQRKRVLLADDQLMILDMMHDLIEPEFEVIGAVTDGHLLVEATEQLQPDIVLLNADMSIMTGLHEGAVILHRHAQAKLLFMTVEADAALAAQAFALGASGFLLKQGHSLELLEAIRTVANGGHYLTRLIADGDMTALPSWPDTNSPLPLSEREVEVLSLLVRGLPMKEVARRLGITARTVAFHKYNAMSLLGLRGNADLVDFAIRNGLLR